MRAVAGMAIAAAAAAVLASCGPPAPDKRGPGTCGASSWASLVGQPRSVLDSIMLPQPVRIREAGSAMTMDYDPARLDVDIGNDGKIARVWCG
jgi:hypothetical protein